MIPLFYTVCLYIVPALYGQSLWIGPFLTVLTPIAVINHAKFDTEYAGKKAVIAIDRVGSHLFAIKLLKEVVAMRWHNASPSPFILWLYILFFSSFAYSALVFHVLKPRASTRSHANIIHASMHFISSIGIVSAIYIFHVCKK